MKIILSLVVTVMLLFSFAAAAAPAGALSKKETTKLLAGNTIDGKHAFKNYSFTMYFKTDGKHVEKRDGKLKPGAWHVSPQGKLCWSYDSKDKTWCRWIVKSGDGYSKVKGKKKKVRHFKVTSGNAKGL